MAELLRTFDAWIADSVGQEYRVRVCGREREGGLWEGWLEFVPADGSPVLRSERETTQPNGQDTVYWAEGLTRVYAEGSLARALDPVPPVRNAPLERPAYDGPAPSRHEGRAQKPIVDPFALLEEGGRLMLQQQLAALPARHLRHIAQHYHLVDPRRVDIDLEPPAVLLDLIVQAVDSYQPCQGNPA